MDGPRITIGVRVVEVDEPPFIPRDYTDLILHRALLAVDVAMLLAIRRMMWRIVACAFIEGTRKATLAGLSAYMLGLSIWNFGAFFARESIGNPPHIFTFVCGIVALWAWCEFTCWWNRRGFDALLGL